MQISRSIWQAKGFESKSKRDPGAAPAASPIEAEQARAPARVEVSTHTALAWSLTALLSIGFALWLVFSWAGYARENAHAGVGFQKGVTQLVEITLIRQDLENLACASDTAVGGLRCAFRANQSALEPAIADERLVLRPYSTVKSELLLGAGLWSSPGLRGQLPPHRFTVVCNYQVLGAVRSVAMRWARTGKFDAAKNSLPVGVLSECAIPE